MIMLTHLAMMLSAVSGWKLPSSDGSAQGSPLSLVNQSEITDGVVLAHDRRLGETGSGCDDGWSVSPHRPTLS